MNELIQYLKQFGSLSEEDETLIMDQAEEVTVPKGRHILESGNLCNDIYFVKSGILRNYFFDRDGNSYTIFFYKKGKFAVDLESFYERSLSSKYIQAETKSELYRFKRASFELFENKIPDWLSITKKITEKTLLQKLSERSQMMTEDATSRYLSFLKLHPDVAAVVPVGHIASYLNISIYTMSRIRKNSMVD